MSRTRLGDVFEVRLNSREKKYFQYVANDYTQLNSNVIRAFSSKYPLRATPDLHVVLSGDVEFHAHVVILWGLKIRGSYGRKLVMLRSRLDPTCGSETAMTSGTG